MYQADRQYSRITCSALLKSREVSLTKLAHDLAAPALESARPQQKKQTRLSPWSASFLSVNSLPQHSVATIKRQTP